MLSTLSRTHANGRWRPTALVALVTLLTALPVVLFAAPAGAAPACTPYMLPGLAGGQAEIIAISPAGIYGGDSLGADGHYHPVYWTHAGSDLSTGWSIHLVPSPLSPLSDAFVGDINAHGLMVATDVNGGGGFVYDLSSGTVTVLPGLGGGNDYDRRINDAGVVAGMSMDTKGVQHAVTWSPPYTKAQLEPAAGADRSFSSPYAQVKVGNNALGINNLGQVVGNSANGGHIADTDIFARSHVWHAAVSPLFEPVQWQATGAPHRLPTSNGQGDAWAINDAGLVVGNVADAQTFSSRPTAWINGTNVDMGAPSDIAFGNAYGLSQGGWAAGGYVQSDGMTSRAFTWDASDGFRTLDPPAPYPNSWSHGVSDTLHQIGGSADDGTTAVAVVWQC